MMQLYHNASCYKTRMRLWNPLMSCLFFETVWQPEDCEPLFLRSQISHVLDDSRIQNLLFRGKLIKSHVSLQIARVHKITLRYKLQEENSQCGALPM